MTDDAAVPHWLSAGSAAVANVPASIWIPVAAAVIAAAAAVWSAFLQRKTGKEATAAARESAAAAQTSANASHRSAKAAEDSVELNRSTTTDAGVRADAAALAERYQDAASQLGHDKAAVRLAGVYAMSRLADDWLEERQTCIDVLCAYLRLPWRDSEDGRAGREEAQVRRTIVSVVNRHVAEDAKVSWTVNDFDFTGAQLRDFVLEGCTFAGRVTFSGAELAGECRFDDVVFQGDQGDVTFSACSILGRVKLADIRAERRRQLRFAATRIALGAELEITTNTKDPKDVSIGVDCMSMVVQGKLKIRHISSFFRQAPLYLDRMELDGGCVEIVSPVSLSKDRRPRYPCKINARDWKISGGSQILIPQKLIDDGTVNWSRGHNQSAIPDDVKITFKVPTVEL